MSSTTNTTFKEREDVLKDLLSSGKKVTRRRLRNPSIKKYTKRPYSAEQQLIRRESKKNTAKAYSAAGMTVEGYIKQSTRVSVDELPKDSAFHNHPFFHGIPYIAKRSNVRPDWIQRLQSIEKEVREINESWKHRLGANEGNNVGISIVTGGTHGNMIKGISGSIHQACVVKGRPKLRKRILECFKEILDGIYGDQAWYKRLLRITTQLNKETNESRTIPGLPLSGLWLSEKPNEESVHCDKNVVGATFLLTSSDVEGSTLCLSTPQEHWQSMISNLALSSLAAGLTMRTVI
jgi:hypothetical protein